MSFFRRLQALYASSIPPKEKPYESGEDAIEALTKVYADYEKHMIPKVIAVLEKTMKGSQYLTEIKEIKDFLKDKNPRTREEGVKGLCALCTKIRDTNEYGDGGLKIIKNVNDRDNVRRFLYVTNTKEQLKNEEIDPKTKYERFLKDFNIIGRANILGEKTLNMRTEKGKVFFNIQKTLARAKNIFSPRVETSVSMTKDELAQESKYREGLDKVSADFKAKLEKLHPQKNIEEAYVYRLAIQALDTKPFNQEAVSRSYAEISLYIKNNSVSFIARKNILDGMKPYIDEKIVSQFKKDVAASKDFEPSYIPKHLKR